MRHFFAENKLAASICHGAQVLVAAGVGNGCKISTYPAVGPEVAVTGSEYADIPVDKAVTDGNLMAAPADFATQAAQLEARLDALIDTRRQLTDADNLRCAKRLRKHREHLLRFLYVDGLAATNNQAERMLRPAVITRKTGGCNTALRPRSGCTCRTAGGAQTHSILASVLTTCRQQRFSILEALIKIQRNVGKTLKALAPPQPDTS